MSSPAVKSPGYQKYVLRWDERPAAGTSEYEAIQSRILQVFREWSAPEGFTIHQFVICVGDWGGYMVFETGNLADIHFLSTAPGRSPAPSSTGWSSTRCSPSKCSAAHRPSPC